MKTILVGDTHLKSRMILPIVEKNIAKYEIGQIVMLGDYLDDWNCSIDSKLYWDELNYLIEWKNRIEKSGVKVITLLGNHDAPYLIGELKHYSLHKDFDMVPGNRRVADVISDKLTELGVQIAYQLDDFLVSHAGYCMGQNLQDWHLRELTLSDSDLRSIKELENRVSKSRGGWSLVPSPLWADFHELLDSPNPDYPKQIVGHTPQEKINIENGLQTPYQLINIDTFNLAPQKGYPYYEYRGDGDLLLYDKGELSVIKTNWRNKTNLEQIYAQRSRDRGNEDEK